MTLQENAFYTIRSAVYLFKTLIHLLETLLCFITKISQLFMRLLKSTPNHKSEGI